MSFAPHSALTNPGNAGYDFFGRFPPGDKGAAWDFQSDANRFVSDPHVNSERDMNSLPDANGTVESEMLIDPNDFSPGDISQGEIIFVVSETNLIGGASGPARPSERAMGLSRLNEWLRSPGEGLKFGEHKNASLLREAVSIKGVMKTTTTGPEFEQKAVKSVTVIVGGRAVTQDCTAYTRGTGRLGPQARLEANDFISICFRRIVPQNPLKIAEAAILSPYWQAIPHRHAGATPPPLFYRSIPYMTDSTEQYVGFYFTLGRVRMTTANRQVNSLLANERAYQYCFEKDRRNQSNLKAFYELPSVEVYLKLSHA